jgi:hypothetical protein
MNIPNMVLDQNLGAISRRQLELQCQLLDIKRRGAVRLEEEYRKLLSTFERESTTGLPTVESRSTQSAPSATASADQQQRCVRHGSSLLIPSLCDES